jgi:anti-anti-sigma factor
VNVGVTRNDQVRCTMTGVMPRVALTGDVDLALTPQLDAAHDTLCAAPPSDVVVDLSGVTLLSCIGLGFVSRLEAEVSRTGHRVLLATPSKQARHVLTLARFPWRSVDVP